MQQTIVLKTSLPSAVMSTPFPAGQDLKASRICGQLVVHHPGNDQVTKIVKAENVKRIVFRSCSIRKVLEAFNLS